MERKWFVYANDQHLGPFRLEEIEARMDAGAIPPTAPVWAEGWADWAPLPEAKLAPQPVSDSVGKPIWKSEAEFTVTLTEATRDARERRKLSSRLAAQKRRREIVGSTAAILAVTLPLGGKLLDNFLNASNPPLAALKDVSAEEYRDLVAVAAKPSRQAPRAALALSTGDLAYPSFYLSTNLPERAHFTLQLSGVSGTLADRLSVTGKAVMDTDRGFAHIAHFRQESGEPLPRGEYVVTASQGNTVLAKKTYFLGGARDASYTSAVTAFRERVTEKAQSELMELHEYATTLETQLSESSLHYDQGLRSWKAADARWLKLENRVTDRIRKSSPADLEQNYLYSSLFAEFHAAFDAVEKVHAAQARCLEAGSACGKLASQISSDASVAQSLILSFKSRIGLAETLPPTANGMPQTDLGTRRILPN